MILGVLILTAIFSITIVYVLPGAELLKEASEECRLYCLKQPRIMCVGKWIVSGVYPDCSCRYVCDFNELMIDENKLSDYDKMSLGNDYFKTLISYGFNMDSLSAAEHELFMKLSEKCSSEVYPVLSNRTTLNSMNVFDEATLRSAEQFCLENEINYDFSWVLPGQNYTQYMMYSSEGICPYSAMVSASIDVRIIEYDVFENCLRNYFYDI